MKRIEATHFIEVFKTKVFEHVDHEEKSEIVFLEKALQTTTSLGWSTIAIFKIRFK